MTSPIEPPARPAEQAWCLICRTWRPFRCVEVPVASRRHRADYDADDLVCRACNTTLLTVASAVETKEDRAAS